MAKYDITYRCGCKNVVRLFGREVDRQRKIAWYSTIVCLECAAKNVKNEHNLEGSPKQIVWANRIIEDNRRRIQSIKNIIDNDIKWIEKNIEMLHSGKIVLKSDSTLTLVELIEQMNKFISELQEAKDNVLPKEAKMASWWIENRESIMSSIYHHPYVYEICTPYAELIEQNCEIMANDKIREKAGE